MVDSSDILISGLAGGGSGGLADVVDDTTPKLGGNLDVNGNSITSPDGTDKITIIDGTLTIQTNSVTRVDITDTGVQLGGAGVRITTILDEDTMATDSATAVPTQQSVKAYVDTEIAGVSAVTSPDTTDTLTIVNGTLTVQTNSVTRYDVTDSGLQLGGSGARITTILDEDTMTSDSATAIPTQQSVKAYVDTEIAGAGGGDSIPNSGYAAARYYHSFFHTISSTAAYAVDTLYGQPTLILNSDTTSGISFNVSSTGTATAARVGIYNMAAGVPATLVVDAGTADVTGTGIKEVSIAQALTPGLYCLVIVLNGTCTLSRNATVTSSLARALMGSESWTSDDVKGFTAAHTYAALPASYPTLVAKNIDIPAMTLRF